MRKLILCGDKPIQNLKRMVLAVPQSTRLVEFTRQVNDMIDGLGKLSRKQPATNNQSVSYLVKSVFALHQPKQVPGRPQIEQKWQQQNTIDYGQSAGI